MVDIRVKKGLNLPVSGRPESEKVIDLSLPEHLALDLGAFQNIRFNFLAKPGAKVKVGDPIAQDKDQNETLFISPASGIVKEIIRGEKRRPLKVVIDVQGQEYKQFDPPDSNTASKEDILGFISSSGFLSHLKRRPCDILPSPKQLPEAIFVKAVESAPFIPKAELQAQGFEKELEKGLETLSKLTENVHLIRHELSGFKSFSESKYANTHTVTGPYPACSSSIHIYNIHPLLDASQVVWTLDVSDVITLGALFLHGKYHVTKVISRSGDLLPEKDRNYLRVYRGHPLGYIFSKDIDYHNIRILSGNPLTGSATTLDGFLGFNDYSVSLLRENIKRQPLHFLSLGLNKYSATKGYLSGFFKKRKKPYEFSSNQHGEERAFVESDTYQDVMPMRIPVMDLVKAILAEDFEKAEELGLLEVSPEDFILPTFICPSKVEMYQIVKEGLYKYAEQYLSK